MKVQCRFCALGMLCALFLGSFNLLSAQNEPCLKLGNEHLGWEVYINAQNGTISRYRQYVKEKWELVPFRYDSLAGPSWAEVQLSPVKKHPFTFSAKRGNLVYSLNYKEASDHLIVECSLGNEGKEVYSPECSRLFMGIDSEMKSFPQWDSKFFPTLLRCEKNFAWGYFMSPRQVIMGFGVEDPVASYALNYINEGSLEWKWGNRIKIASLDLLHTLPLPGRHPQNMTSLQPGETKKWTIHLGGIADLNKVKQRLSEWIQAPMMECSRYTLTDTETSTIRIYSKQEIKDVVIQAPDGKMMNLATNRDSTGFYEATFTPDGEKGVHTITVTAANGKTAEATVYVRNPWSWYLKNAGDFVAENPPLFSNGCEAFYGYYTAFLAARHFPDKAKDASLKERFEKTLPVFIDTLNWIPQAAAAPDRVQNFATLIGMLVDLWEATGAETYLEKASHVGDYLCSAKIQWADGSYRSKGTHYTAVIYPAKSMLELATAEKALIASPQWKERYERHRNSAGKAIKDLQVRLDDIETEGSTLTFEDGMISCSTLQLALQGLQEENAHLREIYSSAAQYMKDKHRCLEQLLIPDCRMRGCTLRYWEVLDVYFVPNQAMSSPHGWTAWKIYASYYLYLLTGKSGYLTDFMDTLGACAQIMDLNGHLRWAFIPDPYIKGKVCIENKDKKHNWIPTDSIVGEQYMDMISPWLRPDNENEICAFGERGGAGDNTVQEIFKAMEECVLTSAYVIIDKNGAIQAWNCLANYEHGVLNIIPDEDIISGIHLNLEKEINVKTVLKGKTVRKKCPKGMGWIGETPFLIR